MKNSVSDASKPLTLDLGRMRYTNALGPNQTLHEKQARDVLAFIKEQVEELAAAGDLTSTSDVGLKQQYRHRHQAILVQGERGAGKTTLLLTVMDALKQRAEPQSAHPWLGDEGGWLAHVHALPQLDPTLVEGDEVFLGTIIANILRALRDKHGGHFWNRYTKLRDTFESLAKSLRVLEPRASAHAFKDAATSPDLFAERLLSNALSGLDLAACFHDFCIEACRALGVRLLLQPLDDADVSIREGWDVLETVRRYLSNAHILPVMLGDLSLFRLVIEQEQLKRLKKLKVRSEDIEKVRQLSEQYLLKLLRPERRVRLPGAIARLEAAFEEGREVRVVPPGRGSDAQPLTLETLLGGVGERVFGVQDARPDELLALFSENLRESRGVLMWLAQVYHQKDPIGPQVISGYLSAFSGTWLSQDLPLDALDALMAGRLDPWMRWLIRVEGGVREPLWALDLLPDSRDGEPLWIRTLKFAVAGILYLRWQTHRAEQLRYFGATLSPMMEWPEPGGEYATRVKAFRERLRLGRGEPAWLTAARVTVKMIDPSHLTSTAHTVFFGPATRLPPRSIYRKEDTYGRILVAAERFRGKQKHATGLKPWLDTVAGGEPLAKNRAVEDYLIPVLDRWRRDTFGDAWLIVSWFKVVARRGSRTYELLDPWKGIAGIGDLVRAWGRGKPIGDASQKRDALASILRRMMAQSELSIPVVGDDKDAAPETLDPIDDAEAGEDELAISTGFLDALVGWLDSANDRGRPMAPHGWAQVAQRFGDNLNRINEELDPAEHSAGADLERWVLAFLNNLLFVEADVRGIARTGRGERLVDEFSNRGRDANGKIERVPFSTNLGRVDPVNLPVFHWLAQCPILTAVLAEDWRRYLQRALNRNRASGSSEVELATFTGAVAHYAGVDVHTALCALVPRFQIGEKKEKEKAPFDSLTALRAAVREMLGWTDGGAPGEPDDADGTDDDAET